MSAIVLENFKCAKRRFKKNDIISNEDLEVMSDFVDSLVAQKLIMLDGSEIKLPDGFGDMEKVESEPIVEEVEKPKKKKNAKKV